MDGIAEAEGTGQRCHRLRMGLRMGMAKVRTRSSALLHDDPQEHRLIGRNGLEQHGGIGHCGHEGSEELTRCRR